MQPQVFISHRHDDEEIADAIRRNLEDWGHRAIFQSADARHGPRVGTPLDEPLRDALSNTKLIILIYTFADHDWSYCMWECGVTIGVNPENKRVIIFQCTEDVPKLFEGQRRIAITDADLLRFTTEFHKEKDFFPGNPVFSPDSDEELLERRSHRLYNELLNILPPKKIKERYRWDFLTLQLNQKYIKKITDGNINDNSINIIKNKSTILEAYGDILKHFGFDVFQDDIKFKDLVERWRASIEDLEKRDWVDDLCNEILRVINNEPSRPTWNYLKSARPGTTWWFHPIVNRVRVEPDGTMQFDICLYRVPEPRLE